jgi:predicted DNA-binding protein (MmcQ/YjbR family)
MTIEEIQTICKALPGVKEDIKWDVHLCFNVGGKMFLVTSPDEVPATASFKVTEEEFEALCATDGFFYHQHMGRHQWVHLDDINKLNKKQWEFYIHQSFQLVSSKLSKKLQMQLGIS